MKTFKHFILTAITTAAFTAHAGGISLAPLGNDESASIVKTFSVYGSCGDRVVQVVGVDAQSWQRDEPTFSFDDSSDVNGVYILGDQKRTRIGVSDHNTVLCVPVGEKVGTEFRLVFGSTCSGSRCTDALSYTVFDPKKMVTVSPASCDVRCASKLVKSNVLTR